MLLKLDPEWLLMAFAVVSILSFLLGYALEGIMGKDSFGAFSNMIIIVVSFFGGILLANELGFRFRDLIYAVGTGLGSAFICLFVLVALKGLLKR